MSLDQVANFKKVTVSTGYDAAATSIVLSSGQGAGLPTPASGAYNLVWWNSTDYTDPTDDPNVEIVRVTAKSTDTLTITRAQESTSASTKNTAGKTYKMILGLTAKMITDITAGLPGTFVDNEVVSGSGTSWTLANTPIVGSVKLHAGTRLIPGPGAGTDYTISATAITTTVSYPTGSLIADYRK